MIDRGERDSIEPSRGERDLQLVRTQHRKAVVKRSAVRGAGGSILSEGPK